MFSKLTPLAETNIPPLLCANAAGRLLHSDSRQIKQGDIFVACQGEYTDGRSYIPAAIANGAAFVFWDDDGKFAWNPEWKVPNQGIKDLKHRAGMLAAQVYGNVSDDLKVWGVTGTNGKTSITQWLAQAADLLGEKTTIIGTVGNGFWGALEETTHTTPAPVDVQTLLYRFRQQGATAAAMEVSSHGLDQSRVNGVPFRSAIFTNLTRDHLDYHGTMEAYGAIKSRLFYWHGLKHAVINVDDEYGAELAGRLKKTVPIWLFTATASANTPTSALFISPLLQTAWKQYFKPRGAKAAVARACLDGSTRKTSPPASPCFVPTVIRLIKYWMCWQKSVPLQGAWTAS